MVENDEKIVIQSRIGEVTITPDRVIVFPRGLIGFEKQKRFTLLQLKEDSTFMLLQNLDDERLGLLVTDPYLFLPEYEVRIGDAEQKILQVENIRQLAIMVTVTIPAGKPEETTLNLSGPICINTQARIGLQVPQTNPDVPSHLRFNIENGVGE
jgi:flagellar assembly factor FliW